MGPKPFSFVCLFRTKIFMKSKVVYLFFSQKNKFWNWCFCSAEHNLSSMWKKVEHTRAKWFLKSQRFQGKMNTNSEIMPCVICRLCERKCTNSLVFVIFFTWVSLTWLFKWFLFLIWHVIYLLTGFTL